MANKNKRNARGLGALKQQGREEEIRNIAAKGGSAYHEKRGNHGSDGNTQQ